jgi:hypothetical protein
MSRVNGIKCDWCGKTADLVGDRALPARGEGDNGPWSTLVHVFGGQAPQSSQDLCDSCTQATGIALSKVEKRCKTGRKQR